MDYTQPVVRDLYFDYNFKLAKRAESITYRIDYSNQPGYWEHAVGHHDNSGRVQRRDMTTPWKRNIFKNLFTDIGGWGMDVLDAIDDATTWTHSFKDESKFQFNEMVALVDKECEGNGMATNMHVEVQMDGYVSGGIAFGISLLVRSIHVVR